MPKDLNPSLIGSSQLPPPFRGIHSPGVRKHCQIIFACYFRKSCIVGYGTEQANSMVMEDQSPNRLAADSDNGPV